MTRFPPGPKSRYPGGSYFRFRADPLGFLENVAREFGDVACWKFGLQRVFLINNPDLIRNVLVTHGPKFLTGLERAKDVVEDKVGDKLVYVSGLTGNEYFDAVVDLAEISAVVVRAKK